MRKPLARLAVVVLVVSSLGLNQPAPSTQPAGVLGLTMNKLDGTPQPLSHYAGKVVLIVNTASKCGYTKQYAGLEALHRKYSGQGLAVLGFPANDFKQQEPGTDAEIAAFCKENYGVTFDLFSKINVGGDTQSPLYKILTSPETNTVEAGPVKWNVEKFLLSREGKIVARFRSNVAPDNAAFIEAIAKSH